MDEPPVDFAGETIRPEGATTDGFLSVARPLVEAERTAGEELDETAGGGNGPVPPIEEPPLSFEWDMELISLASVWEAMARARLVASLEAVPKPNEMLSTVGSGVDVPSRIAAAAA